MRRPLFLFIAAGALGSAFGWAVAQSAIETRQIEANEKARFAARELQRPGLIFSRLIRSSDEVVITCQNRRSETKTRMTDEKWFSQFSLLLQQASYRPTPVDLWISQPEIGFYRHHLQVLSLMTTAAVLRGFSQEISGDFAVGPETVSAMNHLVAHQWEPGHGRRHVRPSSTRTA